MFQLGSRCSELGLKIKTGATRPKENNRTKNNIRKRTAFATEDAKNVKKTQKRYKMLTNFRDHLI